MVIDLNGFGWFRWYFFGMKKRGDWLIHERCALGITIGVATKKNWNYIIQKIQQRHRCSHGMWDLKHETWLIMGVWPEMMRISPWNIMKDGGLTYKDGIWPIILDCCSRVDNNRNNTLMITFFWSIAASTWQGLCLPQLRFCGDAHQECWWWSQDLRIHMGWAWNYDTR